MTFPRVYPLALGISQVSPLKMARAFSIFANQGREVSPISIRSIEDRSGRTILDPEKDLRSEQKKKGTGIQVISPQNAYVMTDLLKRVVKTGTLAYPTAGGASFTYKDADGKRYTIPAAGKTGTTQNWADAWTVGFTPYMSTAIWFGFDRPGNSLGVSQSGAAVAGIAWANYMSEIHQGLPFKDFIRPQNGLIDVTVCSVSGLLPTEYCDEGSTTLTYYEGTQPKQYCDLHQFKSEQAESTIRNLSGQQSVLSGGRIDSGLDFDPSDIDALLKSLGQILGQPDPDPELQPRDESTMPLTDTPPLPSSSILD